MRKASLILLALVGSSTALKVAGASLQGLQRALSARRAVVVELAQAPGTAPPTAFDLDELSSKCRAAGAAALVVPASVLPVIAAEKAAAVSSYPGPVPLICQLVPTHGEAGDEPVLEVSSLPLAELRA